MPMERDFPCSLLGSVKTLGVSKALNICRVDTELRLKAGCPQSYLKNAYGSLIESLVQLKDDSLIIDNCTAHPHVENLERIELIFLPLNTTSVTQPMDQGIIRSVKAKYRSLAVRKLISALERKTPLPTISILSAMIMLSKTWNAVSNTTFTNRFKKAGISEEAAESALDDEDAPFAGLEEEDSPKTLESDLVYFEGKIW